MMVVPAGGGVAAALSAGLEVRPVRGRRELGRFLKLPWRIYARDPAWVPPLLHDVKRVLDRARHPFHRHAEVEYFLAWRGREPVGRIAAVVNHQYNEFHGERTGFFGLFEAVEDPAVSGALLAEAEAWLRARGQDRVLGPLSFSTNEEISVGLLVEGFQHPPAIMMAHNPRYYARLLEGAEYAPEKDLLAYWIDGPEPPERLIRALERVQRERAVRIRPLDMRRFRDEVDRIKEVYNSAWERNWGFVPMTDEEFEYLAGQLRPVVDPRLCLIAEADGETAGFALALPDYNRALRHVNGRLFPLGIFKLLWHRRRIHVARVITLGLKPGFRRSGLDALLYLRLFQEGPKAGYTQAECSWILEDNWEMRRGLERMGARVYKRYRVYGKGL